MPKKVDHHERRLLIADALMRLAGKHGLDQVSLRHVATEAGASTGMVQHYFRTKDEMMAFALSVVREHVQHRITAAVATLGPSPAPRDLLRATLVQTLPLDEARQADGRVALAFQAYTAVRPDAAAVLHDETTRMLGFVADQIRHARRAGDTADHVDPDAAAVSLLAVAEGMATYLLGGHISPAMALGALDAHLRLIFKD